MSSFLIPALAMMSASLAAAAVQPRDSLDMPSYKDPAKPWNELPETDPVQTTDCDEEIGKVREESGQAELERKPDTDGTDPQRIYAVDRRETGCPVMVMQGDVSDIRPVPNIQATPRLVPAN